MCITPLTLAKTYRSASLERTQVVPCGKCHQCLKDRRNAWVFRLKQEQKQSTSAAFITLTYETPPLSFNGHETLNPDHLKNFWKRLRKHIYHKNPNLPKLKYFAVGEYGDKMLRPHYHAIVFNLPQSLIKHSTYLQDNIWQHGHVHIAPSNGATQSYTCSYIINGRWEATQDDDDRTPQFQRQSQNLGLNYITPQMARFHIENLLPIIAQDNKTIQKLPRYYKDKIFSKSEKAQMAQAAQELRNLSMEDYINYDYSMEVAKKKNKIRQFELQQKLKTKTL